MNRQIIPSMILSVLIVCFFSIVLYERDKPGALARPSGGDPAPAATSASASQHVDRPAATSASTSQTSQNVDKPAATSTAASKGPDSSKVVDEGPPREIKELVKTETPSASTADKRAESSPAAGLEKAEPVRVAEAPAVPAVTATAGPGSAPSQVATRSADPVNRPKEKPASHAAGSSPASTAHRSAFTTVQDGETLEDVTIRIYGSSDQLDLLWRANRDLLPRRNSPLSAGAVLRTPED